MTIKSTHHKDGVTLEISGDSLPLVVIMPGPNPLGYIVTEHIMAPLPDRIQRKIVDGFPPEAFRLSDLSQSKTSGN